jgi:adenylate cyclase
MSDDSLREVAFGMNTVVSSVDMIMNDDPPLLSVLFAGVSGSAKLHEKLGNTEALRAVDRCLKRVERAVVAFDGRIVKTVGDELMAVFDDADDALQASVEMQQRVADLPPVSGVKLAIRVGFSHGEVGSESDEFVGDIVNEAAHLAGLAKPGQILTSIHAQSMLSPTLKKSTRDLGETPFKDMSSGLTVFEVVATDNFPAAPMAMAVSAPEDSRSSSFLCTRFSLRYFGETVIVDESNPIIHLGRDANSDVVIHDRRASRNHAKIEWRDGKIILADKSTNGTFVTLRGTPEIFLRHDECLLRDKGVICFASSATGTDADCAEFELV